MAEIDGGSLSFKSVMDNDQLNKAIEETLRRVQGYSDAIVGTGDAMDAATQEIVDCINVQKQVINELENKVSDLDDKMNTLEPGDAQNIIIEQANAAKQELEQERQGLVELEAQLQALQQANSTTAASFEEIRSVLEQIGAACQVHETALESLESEYQDLGQQMADAFMQGRDDEYRALRDRHDAINGEIVVRKNLLNELRQQSNALEEEATKMEQARKVTEETATAHVTLRTQIRNVREAMADLIANGVSEQSAEYKEMANELGRLQDRYDDIYAQGRALANDEAQFAGMLSGLQGVVGGFTAAQGAVALFGEENENLQKIMLKVQSLMSITMGLQQVAQMLNKDSAFQLITLNGLKQWWNNLLEIGRNKQVAETAATVANTAAQQQNTIATGANAAAQSVQNATATAGTTANIGLAGAFRMVGAAIKSIPVFGWILAGVSALIGLVAGLTKNARDAEKAQKELFQSIADNVYKPIASVEELSIKWKTLGDDFDAKQKFIEANKKAFDELGVAINGVTDAENLLNANKQAFVDAQIEKAKAMLLVQQSQEKVKALMEKEQEYNAMPNYEFKNVLNSNNQYVLTQVVNDAKVKLGEEIKAMRDEITQGFTDAANAESNGFKLMEQAGIEAAGTYADGTLGAIEQAISHKREALKNLSSNEEYEEKMKEIENLQKQADVITGKKTTDTSGNKDPFAEKLNKYKAEYTRFQKWVNSGDSILVKSANQEFEALLKEGATYIDYLKNQRDQILAVDIANRTKEQNKQLQQLNDSIAEETKKTVLESFNAELNAQLANAQTTLEMLNIIEQRRKELANDGTDLDNAKAESLNDAEESTKEQIKQDTQALLDEYAGYVAQKRMLEEQFNADIALLQLQRSKTTNAAEIAEIDAAIANRTKKFQEDSKGSGNSQYDAMLAEYGTFEQKKQAIIDEYDEKRRIAQEQGNAEMINELNKAQAQALSKFALDELQAHPDWELMFDDLDDVTTKKLQELINKINSLDGAYLGIEFKPEDLETLKDKVKEMQEEIQSRNPFKSLTDAVKEYREASDKTAKKESLNDRFESAAAAIDIVSGSLDAVVGGLEKMGVQVDEQTQAIIDDIGGILDGANQVATGIATGNPLSIIQGSIGLLSSAFDLFNSRDRKAERRIKRHKENSKQLENQYQDLARAVEKALGGDVYSAQLKSIANLRKQQAELAAMQAAERSKKKSDSDKIEEYQNQYKELGNEIEDMFQSIADDILQINASSFADSLGDSLVDAFKSGEDAAQAFEQTVNEVLQNAIVNQLKKNFLEKQLQSALDNLYNDMGYWSGDNFIFDGLSDAEIASFKEKVQAAANNYEQALDVYKDLFKDIGLDEEDSSLAGAVKGVSEETANILAGQMNAIRINQIETTSILRQQLLVLNTIAANTQYNRYLAKIDRIVTLLENSGDSGRSQGLM